MTSSIFKSTYFIVIQLIGNVQEMRRTSYETNNKMIHACKLDAFIFVFIVDPFMLNKHFNTLNWLAGGIKTSKVMWRNCVSWRLKIMVVTKDMLMIAILTLK